MLQAVLQAVLLNSLGGRCLVLTHHREFRRAASSHPLSPFSPCNRPNCTSLGLSRPTSSPSLVCAPASIGSQVGERGGTEIASLIFWFVACLQNEGLQNHFLAFRLALRHRLVSAQTIRVTHAIERQRD